jgi:hypothetical protein
MDLKHKKDLDRILRTLYKSSPQAWYSVYTDLGLEKDYADHLFNIGFAFDYLEIVHKGAREYPGDNHYVGITKEGVRFFSLDNFAKDSGPIEGSDEVQRYNLFINGSSGGFNVLDVDNVQLEIVVEAYLNGKGEFTIAGHNYHPKKFHIFKIYQNSSGMSERELKAIGKSEGSKRGLINRYFSTDDLEQFGKDITYSIIGNQHFGSKKDNSDKASAEVEINSTSVPEGATVNNTNPQIFVSYCWDNPEHEDHVLSFTNKLRQDGFNVDLDKIRSQSSTATNFDQMMHEAFASSEKIIIVLSEGYKKKADAFQGGVGVEYRLILGEINRFPNKYILISFNGRKDNIIPGGFVSRDIVDLSNLDFEPLYRKLTGKYKYKLSPIATSKPELDEKEIPPFEGFQKKKD